MRDGQQSYTEAVVQFNGGAHMTQHDDNQRSDLLIEDQTPEDTLQDLLDDLAESRRNYEMHTQAVAAVAAVALDASFSLMTSLEAVVEALTNDLDRCGGYVAVWNSLAKLKNTTNSEEEQHG